MSNTVATGSTGPRKGEWPDGKRLNQMDRLGDVERFPLPVMLGAALNVLVTVGVVWHFEPRGDRYYLGLLLWITGVLMLNLLPVMLLRVFTLRPDSAYPVIEKMDFFRDQHKFSNWVYLMPSANMAVWISITWMTSAYGHAHARIVTVMVAALAVTLSPVWARLLRRLAA